MFLSIFAATCRPNNIVKFLDNLANTCDDPTSFEVLLKIDEGDNNLINIIETYKQTSSFCIKYLASAKLDGYYSLDVGYNELLKITHPDTYFCWLLTDEIRFETKGWDSILKRYIGFYKDDIFRLKLSVFSLKNYYDFFECLPCPDNYAVTTRKWLEITGGWGHFWGPDSWHQCIDYYLGLCKNDSNPYGIWRSVPIFDITVGGQEAGQGIAEPNVLWEREKRIYAGWQKHSSHHAQKNYYRLAQRLNCHIIAREKSLDQYIIKENHSDSSIKLYDIHCKKLFTSLHYNIPRFYLDVRIGRKNIGLRSIIRKYSTQFMLINKIKTFAQCLVEKIKEKGKQLKQMLRKSLMILMLPFLFIKKKSGFFSALSQKKHQEEYIYDGKYLRKLENHQPKRQSI